MPRLLVVDDEPGVQESLRMLLKEDCEVATAGSVDEALERIESFPPDLVLLDLVMPGRSGLELLSGLAEAHSHVPVIVLSATKTVATAVEAMKRGAADYVTKPFEVEALRIKVRQLLERSELEREVVRLRDEVTRRSRLGELIGGSPEMQDVFRTIERVAAARSNVLITGESGTGKELVARAIHSLGSRSDQPFVAINCAAIPHTLIESELFGHERGAFTDAHDRRIGRFEAAHGGTLFLDEVGELPLPMQAKLLRVLQERTIERLGDGTPIPVDVRIVVATNRDLEVEVEAGRFRQDLLYRIKVVPIHLPPLRERRTDVRLIAEHLLERLARENGRPAATLAPDALAALERYAWPGNVRELENAIERALTLAPGDRIGLDDLPEDVAEAARVEGLRAEVRAGRVGYEDAVAAFESDLLREALDREDWNQTRAAERLGITRRLLKLKMDKFELSRD